MALGAVAAPTTATAHGGGHGVKVLYEGLSSPKGLATAWGSPVVAQGAFGPPGPVLVFPQFGRDRGEAIPITDPASLIDIAVSPKDGTGWGIGPGELDHAWLFHRLHDGTIDPVFDITAYQATDPDPHDQEGIPDESNPYGLTVDRKGNALIADAAGNDIIRVTPHGDATTVARFDLKTVSTDHLPPEMGLPPEMTAEAVPTTVTVGPDGAIYVGQLMGFPFRPGSSNVWRIDPHAKKGVLCSVNTPSRGCSVYRSGLTAIQDIAFDKWTHKLYVYELAKDGVLAFEAGFETGEFPPAVLLQVTKHGKREIAKGKLSQPGGIAFGIGGRLYATDGTFGNGRLLRIL
jgi:DNA-binding beta-propeller fold protein YncE